MIKLYPYQDEAVTHAINMLEERGNSLIVAGTGAGKTIMMAAAIGRIFTGFYATNKRKPHVLVLVHRTEIHGQNHSKFSLVCPDIPTSEITAARKSLHGYVHFGMVQTVANLLPEFERAKSFFDLIVFDEAHHAKASTYENIIQWNRKGNPDMWLLGVTATPNRGDKIPMIDLFDNFYQITSKFLLHANYLVKPKFIDLSPTFIVKSGKTEKIETGHIAKNCKMDHVGKSFIANLCDDYIANKEPGKSIIFAPSHECCIAIVEILRKKGRDPAYLGLNLDDVSRKEELEKFEIGASEELINVDICTEGYDFPPLRNLVDFDTNGTQGQWIQKVGRVLRTYPKKTTCTVIDFGGNIELYPDGIETGVDLDGVVKKPKGESISNEDFFKKAPEEKATAIILDQSKEQYTPYNLPGGIETLNDNDYGIVYVSCGPDKDGIILHVDERYILYIGNKKKLTLAHTGKFDDCIIKSIEFVGATEKTDKPISRMQIKMLAPEFPTAALTWDSANCCICWKTWKSTIQKYVRQM